MTEQEEFEFRHRLESERGKSLGSKVMQQVGNLTAGAVRGAGSIGATLLRPFESGAENDARRKAMTDALASMGADPESLAFGAGKIGAEIAGTSGVGGLFAKGAQALGAAPRVVQALTTSGMTTGVAPVGAAAKAADLALRSGAGAVVGGASTALVNPEDAGTGAVIGGAMPGALKLAGAAGKKVGGFLRGAEASPEVLASAKAAQGAGYVIPPTQVKPSLGNRLLEGFSGKLTTAQNASAANAGVTDSLAAKALGLAPDTKITPEILVQIRQDAGKAYEALRGTGTVKADQAYDQALDAIVAKYKGASAGFPGLTKPEVESVVTTMRQPIFTADSAVDAVRVMRDKADAAYGSGDKGLGKAFKEAANALESQLERHLAETGQPAQVLEDFQKSRKLIAKSYTVEGALNKTTGTVDAKKIGAQIQKGKPITDELRQIGDFANQFPKAAQTVERMGSLPQTSPLDWAALASIAGATSNPMLMAGVLARPAARRLVLSNMVQGGLTNQGAPNRLAELLRNQEAQQLMYRSAPVAISGR